MPFFKTTKDIIKTPWENELWNEEWLNYPTLILPPKKEWDYQREMKIEDVNIWEILHESSGGYGVYASWDPYGEFYMITCGFDWKRMPKFAADQWNDKIIETYYGPGAQKQVIQRCKELNMPLNIMEHWVEPEDMWLYQ